MEQLAAEYRDPEPFALTAQGHDWTFYPGGADRLARLIAMLDSARVSIRMSFYIFTDDDCGRAVLDRLVAACTRGVEVHLLIDSFGSKGTSDALFAPLIAAGGRYCCFSPKWTARYLIRNHQKIVVIDDTVGMIGGFNVEHDYFAPPQENGWNDLALELTGPVVGELVRWYDLLEKWTRHDRGQWRAIRRLVRAWNPGDGPVRLLLGGPTRGLSPWARAVSNDLVAGRQLDMIMAYFSPAVRLLARIGRIAKKRETRLLLAAKSDNGATIGASRILYGPLLKRGARIWEFSPCKLHTKLIVLDDAVYVGSANFDMRSLYINLEIMLRIEDRALADRMREFVEQHLPASIEITREIHRMRRTPLNRLRWTLSWFLVTVVDYTVSRRLNLGL
ncbi:MAG: phosphatidylserine/phosphatidylglycerophosphate/cardiolipin synthase family protein [Novosphingobium sp.]|nr:phosphatidylserine/phosphatidylglycerophosphate/cardiolipin synthase family protein [Novosphingobium sp.]